MKICIERNPTATLQSLLYGTFIYLRGEAVSLLKVKIYEIAWRVGDQRMIRRSRLEIYIDILACIRSGVESPTNIMYKANLSWEPLQEYLRSLIEQNLIIREAVGTRERYHIIERGVIVLTYFKKVKDELPPPKISV